MRSHPTACEAGMLLGRALMPKTWNSRGPQLFILVRSLLSVVYVCQQ